MTGPSSDRPLLLQSEYGTDHQGETTNWSGPHTPQQGKTTRPRRAHGTSIHFLSRSQKSFSQDRCCAGCQMILQFQAPPEQCARRYPREKRQRLQRRDVRGTRF